MRSMMAWRCGQNLALFRSASSISMIQDRTISNDRDDITPISSRNPASRHIRRADQSVLTITFPRIPRDARVAIAAPASASG